MAQSGWKRVLCGMMASFEVLHSGGEGRALDPDVRILHFPLQPEQIVKIQVCGWSAAGKRGNIL